MEKDRHLSPLSLASRHPPYLLGQASLSPSPRVIMDLGTQSISITPGTLLRCPRLPAQAFLNPSPRAIMDLGVLLISTTLATLLHHRPLGRAFRNPSPRAITDMGIQSMSTVLAILPLCHRPMEARHRQTFLQVRFRPLHRPLKIWDQLRILLFPLGDVTTTPELPRPLWMLNWQ